MVDVNIFFKNKYTFYEKILGFIDGEIRKGCADFSLIGISYRYFIYNNEISKEDFLFILFIVIYKWYKLNNLSDYYYISSLYLNLMDKCINYYSNDINQNNILMCSIIINNNDLCILSKFIKHIFKLIKNYEKRNVINFKELIYMLFINNLLDYQLDLHYTNIYIVYKHQLEDLNKKIYKKTYSFNEIISFCELFDDKYIININKILIPYRYWSNIRELWIILVIYFK